MPKPSGAAWLAEHSIMRDMGPWHLSWCNCIALKVVDETFYWNSTAEANCLRS